MTTADRTVTVTRADDGSLTIANVETPGWPWPDGPHPVLIGPVVAAAIHAAYLDSVGWWLDEPTGYLVSTTPQAGGGYWVVSRDANGPAVWIRFPDDDALDAPQQILSRYLATLPPQPEPQLGEVWEVIINGKPQTAFARADHLGEVRLQSADFGPPWGKKVHRRLLMTADRKWVGGEA